MNLCACGCGHRVAKRWRPGHTRKTWGQIRVKTIRGKTRRYVIDRNGTRELYARVVMAAHLGRELTSSEVVDHVNGDSLDDRIENLRLFESGSAHMREEFRRGRMDHFKRGPFAPHKPRTHCRSGHSYAEHGYVTASGWRACRACRRVREARSRAAAA